MIAVKKGEKAPEAAPQGWTEAEPYTPEKLYGPFQIVTGRHAQVDPGESKMNPVTRMYKETLRDRNSEPFYSGANLAAPQSEGGFGEKFRYVGGNSQTGEADETARRPGEAPADYAARIQAWAAGQATGAAVLTVNPVRNDHTARGLDSAGPSDEDLNLLDAQTPDEIRKFGTKYGVDYSGLPKTVKREELARHTRTVIKEMSGRA